MSKVGMVVVGLILLGLGLFYLSPTKEGLGDPSHEKNFSTWQEFVPRSGLFKVSLPSFPQYAKDFVSVPNSDQKRRYDMYASEKIDGTLFLINVITYPEAVNLSASDDVFHQVLDELMASKRQNHLVKFEKESFQKYPALSFRIENETFHIEGKIVLVNKRVFVLSYTTLKANFDPIEYQHFIQSFELTVTDNR